MLQKMHPYLSKTAQSPQVVGAAGKTAFFFGTFFWASKRKYRCQAKVTSPGRMERISDCGLMIPEAQTVCSLPSPASGNSNHVQNTT
jgi:hypothetical protein